MDGKQLIMQAHQGEGCDQIYRMQPGSPPVRVSNGKRAPPPARIFCPGNQEVIYASTHLGGDACPPRPDHSQGYVWALHDRLRHLPRQRRRDRNIRQLTNSPGYDAEGTVCKKDGSIVVHVGARRRHRALPNEFRRHGRAATHARAWLRRRRLLQRRLHEARVACFAAERRSTRRIRGLFGQHLVRPTKLELYVGNADGSDATQVTYLNAASFAPFFYPGGESASSFRATTAHPQAASFDLWAINTNGTALERISTAPASMAFRSFRRTASSWRFRRIAATPAGQHDTNVFLASWSSDGTTVTEETGADRVEARHRLAR